MALEDLNSVPCQHFLFVHSLPDLTAVLLLSSSTPLIPSIVTKNCVPERWQGLLRGAYNCGLRPLGLEGLRQGPILFLLFFLFFIFLSLLHFVTMYLFMSLRTDLFRAWSTWHISRCQISCVLCHHQTSHHQSLSPLPVTKDANIPQDKKHCELLEMHQAFSGLEDCRLEAD